MVAIQVHSENGVTKERERKSVGEEVREEEKGSGHKGKLRHGGKHTSQLGRQGSRKALGEDPLSLLPLLSRIHLSPNPFPYFTDNNKERALGA